MNEEPKENLTAKTPRLKLKLPVPNPDVIGLTEDDAVRMRYMEAIEKIGKMESETLIKIQTLSNKFKFKIAIILAGITELAIGALFGIKIEGKCGSTGITIEPQKKESPKK